MRKFLAMAIVAMTTLSCAKENVNPETDGGLQSLAMGIEMSDAKSGRTIVDTEAKPGDLGVLLMKVYDPANQEVGAMVTISAATTPSLSTIIGASELTSSGRIVVETIKSTASYIRVLGYYNATSTWEELTAIDAKDVNAIQSYDFDKVPFASTAVDGKDIITKGTNMGTGNHASHKIWTATPNIKPYFARIQIKGMPIVNGATITLSSVYLNALNKAKDDSSVTTYEGNHAVWTYDQDGNITGSTVPGSSPAKAGDWEADYYTNFVSMSNGDHTDKFSAFNLWAATERPHVILEVMVTPAGGKPAYKGYVTITKLTGGTGSAIEAGKIYNVNLGDLTINIGDITPDPESKEADLYVKVSVDNWAEVVLKPEL